MPCPMASSLQGRRRLEDFVAKFIGVKYVVDPGTSKEKTYVFGNVDDLAIIDDGVGFAESDHPRQTGASSVGDHVVDSYLSVQCDALRWVGRLPRRKLPASRGSLLLDLGVHGHART